MPLDCWLVGPLALSLDQIGREQAALTGDRLAVVPLAGVVSSPLERCQQTAQFILDRQAGNPYAPVDPDLTECDYGQWQGRTLMISRPRSVAGCAVAAVRRQLFAAVNLWPRCRLGR